MSHLIGGYIHGVAYAAGDDHAIFNDEKTERKACIGRHLKVIRTLFQPIVDLLDHYRFAPSGLNRFEGHGVVLIVKVADFVDLDCPVILPIGIDVEARFRRDTAGYDDTVFDVKGKRSEGRIRMTEKILKFEKLILNFLFHLKS